MKIKVYSRPRCGMCHQITNELLDQGHEFKTLLAGNHLKRISEQLDKQGSALPVVEIDGQFVMPQDILAGRVCTDGKCEI